MSGWISVSPAGRMPSFGLGCALGAGEFCALAEGDEQPAAATSAAANATSSVRFIMVEAVGEKKGRALGYHFPRRAPTMREANCLFSSLCVLATRSLCDIGE